jgi:hypothetical protein
MNFSSQKIVNPSQAAKSAQSDVVKNRYEMNDTNVVGVANLYLLSSLVTEGTSTPRKSCAGRGSPHSQASRPSLRAKNFLCLQNYPVRWQHSKKPPNRTRRTAPKSQARRRAIGLSLVSSRYPTGICRCTSSSSYLEPVIRFHYQIESFLPLQKLPSLQARTRRLKSSKQKKSVLK